MNGVIRRRMIMGGGTKHKYCVTYESSPQLMTIFYDAGFCKSIDGLTIEEAGVITNEQYRSIRTAFASITSVSTYDEREEFSGFQYFTKVTTTANIIYSRVRDVILPNNITTITGQAFQYYGGDIIIPNSVTSVAAYGLGARASLIFKSTTPPSWFGDTTAMWLSKNTIYVPDSSVNEYKSVVIPESDGNTGDALVTKITPLSEYSGPLKHLL